VTIKLKLSPGVRARIKRALTSMDGGPGAFDTVAYGELLPFNTGVEPLARE
jgi:hypothetical protein